MTNALLDTQCPKMYAEKEQYKTFLLTLPPAGILDYAREYICRENILIAMEKKDLRQYRTEKSAKYRRV